MTNPISKAASQMSNAGKKWRKRRRLAKNMDEQCIREIITPKRLRYRCQLVQGHAGRHEDYRGHIWPKSEWR